MYAVFRAYYLFVLLLLLFGLRHLMRHFLKFRLNATILFCFVFFWTSMYYIKACFCLYLLYNLALSELLLQFCLLLCITYPQIYIVLKWHLLLSCFCLLLLFKLIYLCVLFLYLFSFFSRRLLQLSNQVKPNGSVNFLQLIWNPLADVSIRLAVCHFQLFRTLALSSWPTTLVYIHI